MVKPTCPAGVVGRRAGYGPGNIVNLLRLLRGDLRGLDLSSPTIRHDLMRTLVERTGKCAAEVNLYEADYRERLSPEDQASIGQRREGGVAGG